MVARREGVPHMRRKKNPNIVHIVHLKRQDGRESPCILEAHPGMRIPRGTKIVELDLSDAEAIPGMAPIDVLRGLLPLEAATNGAIAIEALLLRFYQVGTNIGGSR
jgi:hypothetical protein